ncbi:hypothetical protein [Nonomuraea sp. NPDC049725]
MLKFYTQFGRFPRRRSELHDQVVEHVAKQVQVPASELGTPYRNRRVRP